MASTYSRPASTEASHRPSANGTTAQAPSAGVSATSGAARNSRGLAARGSTVSLVSSLSTSAIGCSRPRGPTRDGPRRCWMKPSTLRSA